MDPCVSGLRHDGRGRETVGSLVAKTVSGLGSPPALIHLNSCTRLVATDLAPQGQALMNISPGFVGIDVSKSTLDIFDAAIGRGERLKNASRSIAAFIERWRDQKVFVLFEATGDYDRLLCRALSKAGIVFARVNPLRARDFARAAGFLAKTDAVDAKMLATMAERLRPPASAPAEAEREQLRLLHRRRDQLVLMRAQERARASEALDAGERDGINRHICWLSAEIKILEKGAVALIAESHALKDAAALLRSAPGIGPVAATTLLALMPEIGTRSPKSIAALAGLAPLNRDSGKERGKRTISGGRKRVRDALYMAALAAKRSSPHFARIYKTMIAAGKAPKLALIAIARKLLIAINAMVRDNAPFNAI
jgi:transposase